MTIKQFRNNEEIYIGIIDDEFYLIIPRNKKALPIEIVIDDSIETKLEKYLAAKSLTILRVYADNYFQKSDSEDTNIKFRKIESIINSDISKAKNIFRQNGIEFQDKIILRTTYKEFAEWYNAELARTTAIQNTSRLEPGDLNNQELVSRPLSKATIQRIKELKELKEAMNNGQSQIETFGSGTERKEKEKAKSLTNGKSLLDDYPSAAFINILFLSFIIIIVSFTWLIFMFMSLN